jgi:hypothetical protein
VSLPVEPIEEGVAINKQVNANTDIFSDITAEKDGYFVIQCITDTAGYFILKLKPDGTNDTITGGLNESSDLTPSSWYEFWITVKKGDRINIQFSANATVTVRMFMASSE